MYTQADREHRQSRTIQQKGEHTQIIDNRDTSQCFDALQCQRENSESIQRVSKPNLTGLPDNLKSGIENLSGFSMDNVRVHYNSSKPAVVQALAYTQGTDIHIAPGQEKHLPHEAWHVAQQMAGRVCPTTNINGMAINDDVALEHEADTMGEKALAHTSGYSIQLVNGNIVPSREAVTQRQISQNTIEDFKKRLKLEGIKFDVFIVQKEKSEWKYVETLNSDNNNNDNDIVEKNKDELIRNDGECFDMQNNRIFLSTTSKERTLFHEMGHLKQKVQGYGDRNKVPYSNKFNEAHNIIVHENQFPHLTPPQQLQDVYVKVRPSNFMARDYSGFATYKEQDFLYYRIRYTNEGKQMTIDNEKEVKLLGKLDSYQTQMYCDMKIAINRIPPTLECYNLDETQVSVSLLKEKMNNFFREALLDLYYYYFPKTDESVNR
ncbi:MAG: DUF4157 domain-containing protein [Paludibacteraceae bacterium]|nr:DUF4157 domain-containing protein [Paludibacteraceae bacterium]